MAHKRAGDIDGAVGWFRRAADLDPSGVTSLLDIGDTMAALGRWAEALDAYEEALGRKGATTGRTPRRCIAGTA
jgi:tetratricopeptide (TPR) repeat protein